MFSTVGAEIKDTYETDGIESAVNLVNQYFGETYNSDNYGQMSTLLANFDVPNYGMQIRDSNIYSLLEMIDGIEHIQAEIDYNDGLFSNTKDLNADQIPSVNTISITEVT
jgi:hypothetical protein